MEKVRNIRKVWLIFVVLIGDIGIGGRKTTKENGDNGCRQNEN